MLDLIARSMMAALGFDPKWTEPRAANPDDWERLPPYWRDRVPSPFEDRDL